MQISFAVDWRQQYVFWIMILFTTLWLFENITLVTFLTLTNSSIRCSRVYVKHSQVPCTVARLCQFVRNILLIQASYRVTVQTYFVHQKCDSYTNMYDVLCSVLMYNCRVSLMSLDSLQKKVWSNVPRNVFISLRELAPVPVCHQVKHSWPDVLLMWRAVLREHGCVRVCVCAFVSQLISELVSQALSQS